MTYREIFGTPCIISQTILQFHMYVSFPVSRNGLYILQSLSSYEIYMYRTHLNSNTIMEVSLVFVNCYFNWYMYIIIIVYSSILDQISFQP